VAIDIVEEAHPPASLLPTKQLDADGALSGALAVFLSFMADTKHVVTIAPGPTQFARAGVIGWTAPA
jgi:hypothetical protein